MTIHISQPIFPQPPVSPDDSLGMYNCLNDIISYLQVTAQNFNIPRAVENPAVTANTFGNKLTWSSSKGTSASYYRIHRHTIGNYAQSSVIAILPADKDPTVGNYQYIDSSDFVVPLHYYWIVPENEVGRTGPISPALPVGNAYGATATGTAVGVGAVTTDGSVALGQGASTFGFINTQVYGFAALAEANNEVLWGSASAPVASMAVVPDAFGARFRLFYVSELITIAAAASTDSVNGVNANDVLLGVATRVTTTIPTAVNYSVTLSSDGTIFDVASSTAAGTTNTGTFNCPTRSTVNQFIRITPDAPPATNAGRVRMLLVYYRMIPATS